MSECSDASSLEPLLAAYISANRNCCRTYMHHMLTFRCISWLSNSEADSGKELLSYVRTTVLLVVGVELFILPTCRSSPAQCRGCPSRSGPDVYKNTDDAHRGVEKALPPTDCSVILPISAEPMKRGYARSRCTRATKDTSRQRAHSWLQPLRS